MDISNLKKEIKTTFDSLADQVDTITATKDKIPQIELDIALGNIRKLYEDIHALSKQNQSAPQNPSAEAKMQQQVREVAPEPAPKKEAAQEEWKPEPQKKPEPQIKPEAKKEEAEKNMQEQTSEADPYALQQKENEKKAAVEKKAEDPPKIIPPREKQKLPEDHKRTADLFSTSQSSLADKFMNEQDKSLGAKMQKNKISDLKSAIGINQKFIFINELFDGDMQEYNKTIDQLNSFSTMDQAMAVLGALRNRHNWNEENGAYQQFVNMIERRFGNV